MGISRKHYERIAKAIDNATCPMDQRLLFKKQLIEELSNYFFSENVFFDYKLFEAACNRTEIVSDESSGS